MSVTSSPTSLEVLNEAKQGLRVEFRLEGDRFIHTIYSVQGADSIPLLESIEGTPDDAFPPSPPIAELHQHNKTLLLTGATTAAHWSMSVESQQQDGKARLIFDVACRIKSPTDQLTSSYKLVPPLGNYHLQPLPLEDGSTQPSCQLISQNNTLQLIRDLKPTETPPATLRWCYLLST